MTAASAAAAAAAAWRHCDSNAQETMPVEIERQVKKGFNHNLASIA
jgi:hypothetical protein